MINRFMVELESPRFSKLQELARVERRSLRDQAGLLLEASLDQLTDSVQARELLETRPAAA